MTIPKRWSFSKSTLVRLIPAQIGLRTTVTSSLSCGVPGISSWRISSFSKTPKNLLTRETVLVNLSLSVREKTKGENTMKSIILAVALVLFASSAYSITYVMETSNALEKEGITVQKVEWNFEHDRAVKVFSKKDGEIVLYKGYKPFFTSNGTFMVYGIIESDASSETYMLMRFDAKEYYWK